MIAGWRATPFPTPRAVLLAGVGSALTILTLVLLNSRTGLAWLVPSFGASCALVFAVPQSPFARSLSVVGGHLVSSAVGLMAAALLGHGAAAMAVGVGCAIAAMMVTKTMHPPAGGDPLIVILSGAGPSFLLEPMLIGSFAVVTIGAAYHRLGKTPAPDTRT